jgi:hypothetical protein
MARTIADKLLIKDDARIWTSSDDHLARVGVLPAGVRRATAPDDATVALLFAEDAASLRLLLADHGDAITRPGVVWVAYPKGNRTDINRDSVWPIVGEHGLRPIGQVAIDDTWSALRFRALAEGEAPFTGR